MPSGGRLLHVNVSRGGVPKRQVDAARITVMGVEGDRQSAVTVHGGPYRAVSILGIEAIERVAAEGHPIAPGTTGENLTTQGFDVSLLPPGTRLAIGDEVELELAALAGPCETIRDSFRDGRFARLGAGKHPGDSRMYARVIAEGEVRPGDVILIRPPADDAAELHELAVRLDEAEASWSRALWGAARDGGEAVHVIADGDLSIAATPEVAWPSFNCAIGLVMLPHLVGRATEHFDRHGVTGWLLAEAPPLPSLPVSWEEGRHAAAPDAIVRTASAAGIGVRELARDEVGPWSEIVAAASDMQPVLARAWRAAEGGLARHAHHHRFIASLDGKPVGAASLHTHHGVGWLCAASVLAEARGRGVQRELLAARAERAVALRCDVIGAAAIDGGASAENVRRMGFRRVATRRAYRYEPPTP
jgi:MOSC domain-containing protein YiiM/GNAT superfamily N-acetyltransferase